MYGPAVVQEYIVQHRLQQQKVDKVNRKPLNVCQSVCRPAAVAVRRISCEPSSRQLYRHQPDAHLVVWRKRHLSAHHRSGCPLTATSTIDTLAQMCSIPSASTPNGPASKTHQRAPWRQHPLNAAPQRNSDKVEDAPALAGAEAGGHPRRRPRLPPTPPPPSTVSDATRTYRGTTSSAPLPRPRRRTLPPPPRRGMMDACDLALRPLWRATRRPTRRTPARHTLRQKKQVN